MGLDNATYQHLADCLWNAEKNRSPLDAFSKKYPELTLEDSREIQMINIRRRVDMGYRIIGKKIGATNKVMREMLNLKEPVVGYILSDIIKTQNEVIDRSTQIKPFVEAEICFAFNERLQGPNIQPYDVLRAVSGVLPAFEIPDIRINGEKNMVDALADNVYNGYLIVGDTMASVYGIDWANIPLTIYKNNVPVVSSSSSCVFGNPLYAIVWLANKLQEYGECIEKGDIVITGSCNPAVYIDAGDVFLADFGPLGCVKAQFA